MPRRSAASRFNVRVRRRERPVSAHPTPQVRPSLWSFWSLDFIDRHPRSGLDRRRYLATVGAVAVAGCTGLGDNGDEGGPDDDEGADGDGGDGGEGADATPSPTPTPAATEEPTDAGTGTPADAAATATSAPDATPTRAETDLGDSTDGTPTRTPMGADDTPTRTTTATPTAGTSGGADALLLVGYPRSGIRIRNDYYAAYDTERPIFITDGCGTRRSRGRSRTTSRT
jgi:hypothetical protein